MGAVLYIYIYIYIYIEESEHLNRLITADEIEAVVKQIPAHKSPGPDGFTGKFYKTIKEELTPILHRLCQKNPRRRKTPKLFLQSQHHLDSKSDKDITKKENFRSISLMNIDTKILNKKIVKPHLAIH